MPYLNAQLENADRLKAIYQQLGSSIWRLQELEGATAQFYVLVALATRGMGLEAGMQLDESVAGNTFGRTVYLLRQAAKVPLDLKDRLPGILKERNWLVHSSLTEGRSAVYNDAACEVLMRRMEFISSEAGSILKLIVNAAEEYATNDGVSKEEIEHLTAQILKSWQEDDPT